MGSGNGDQLFIVEDDIAVQNALVRSLRTIDASVSLFEKPSEILEVTPPTSTSCLIVDYRLPEMNGLEMLKQLRIKGWQIPFVIITGYGDVAGAVSAMQLGALHFLEKPVDESQLCHVVSKALSEGRRGLVERESREQFAKRMSTLTPREMDVLRGVVNGRLNKQIASDLGISIKTIETHRGNLTRKLDVDSVAQLVRKTLEFSSSHQSALSGD